MRNNIKSEVIGVIVRDIEREIRDLSANSFDEPSFDEFSKIDAVYRAYDSALAVRDDYALWRQCIKPHYANRRPWLHDLQISMQNFGGFSASQLLRRCVESSDPVIQWSTVALMPDLIRNISKNQD